MVKEYHIHRNYESETEELRISIDDKRQEIERLNRKLYRHGDYKYRTECNCQRCSGFAVDEYDKEDSDGKP